MMVEFWAAVDSSTTFQVYNHDIYPFGEEDLERMVALGAPSGNQSRSGSGEVCSGRPNQLQGEPGG